MKEQESILMTLDCKENREREKEYRRDCTHATPRNIHTDASQKRHTFLDMNLLPLMNYMQQCHDVDINTNLVQTHTLMSEVT